LGQEEGGEEGSVGGSPGIGCKTKEKEGRKETEKWWIGAFLVHHLLVAALSTVPPLPQAVFHPYRTLLVKRVAKTDAWSG